ncbi:MAG: hypothetical protein Q8Q88_12795 [Phenylobacterium sp.]|uniref:hypothetical protein n=1 Tax=Phenylobacterium sp. TaxID=1871053 RepID=UPI002736A250|nr:hypothetical protein [Phenylobacterium sp.]MDP3747911.1 hypothetical protein [Phenylobacterium sp.]
MSVTRTSSVRRAIDHFEPDAMLDPQAQRRLRGQMERIDYTVYASNQEVIAHVLGHADAGKFQRLAVAAAIARAQWVAAALACTETSQPPNPEQVNRLAEMRLAFEELTEAYEALRRMVERGYLPYRAG